MDILVKNISKHYGDLKVLDNVSLTFRQNQITCLMGISGGGKTTLLHILMKLIKPEQGKIEGLADLRMAAVFQEDRLCEDFDAITNVRLAVGNKVLIPEIKEAFDRVGLKEYENKPVRLLSGGMKRRVAIVRALLFHADVYLMDEPFKGLNEELKNQVIDYVKEKLEEKTVIIVTHEREEASRLGATVVMLSE